MTSRHRPARSLALLAVLAGLVLLLAPPAAAHSELVGTDPAPGTVLPEAPGEVTLTFSEPVRLTPRGITAYDASAEVVPSTASVSGDEVTVVLGDDQGGEQGGGLAEGTYQLVWAVVSEDGHPISGTLTFAVVAPSPVVVPPPTGAVAADALETDRGLTAALTYLGLLGAGGLVVLSALVLPFGAGVMVRRRVRTLARAGALLAVCGAWLQPFLASAYAQGAGWGGLRSSFDPGLVGNEITSAALVTLGLGVAVLGLTTRAPGPGRQVLVLAGSLVAVSAPAWAGHSRAYGPEPLVLAVDTWHLAAGAVWFGGLVGLAAVLRPSPDPEEAATVLARFSALAAGMLLVVGGAGAVLAWRVLGSWSGLVGTTYGVLLLVKVGLVLVVAAVGGWNRLRLLPRVRAASHQGALTQVRRAVGIEAALLVGVLGVTGFLVSQPPVDLPEPPRPPEPVVETLRLGEAEVSVRLTPGGTGGNRLSLQVRDAEGDRFEPRRAPTVELRSDEFDLGTLALRDLGSGAYESLVPIPRGGDWTLRVGLRTSRTDEPEATIDFTVPEP